MRMHHAVVTALVVTNKEIGLDVNADNTKYMFPCQNAGLNHNIRIDYSSPERVEEFKYLGTTQMNQNSLKEAIKGKLKSGNACCHLLQNLLSSSFLSKSVKIETCRGIILLLVLYGCETWPHTLREAESV